MKIISPGVVALRPFRIDITEITTDMVHWWVLQGGEVLGKDESYYDGRGRPVKAQRVYMRRPNDKWCHYHQNGGVGPVITLHMREVDAPLASLFILKFHEYVIEHTLKVAEPQLD